MAGIDSVNNENNYEIIKPNAKKDDAKTAEQRLIFDAVDQNDDGVISEAEYQGVVKGKIKDSKGNLVEQNFIKIKDLDNKQALVVDKSGKQWIMDSDGTILNQTHLAVHVAKENLKKATQEFEKQLSKDGWAGKFADRISILWNSKNRAKVVDKDLEKHSQLLQELSNLASDSEDFRAKFQEIFGIEYNEQAVNLYLANPTEENYTKAFGNQNDIQERVEKYNTSQEVGATVVKTGATIAGTVAVGVATGGTGLVAAAAISAGTSLAVNASDRLTSEDGLQAEDAKDIIKQAALDGVTVGAGGKIAQLSGSLIKGAGMASKVARGAINTSGDIIVGIGQEYVETGKVTASGVLTNAAVGSLGIAAESGVLQKMGDSIKKAVSNTDAVPVNNLSDLDGNLITGGWFKKSSTKPVTLNADKGWQNFKTKDGEITLLVSGDKVYYGKVGDTTTRPLKVQPGENKLLGQTEDGLSIVLEGGTNGSYTVKYIENGSPSPVNTSSSTVKKSSDYTQTPLQVSDKHISKKVQTNIKKANSNADDPGNAVISKLAGGSETGSSATIKGFDSSLDLSNISQKVAPGDVFTVGNGSSQKLYVNNNGVATELKISKEKFEELFPQNGFALIEQNGLNNCWLVSRLNSMIGSTSGRAQLYSMLEETPNGDIIVKLKNSKPITFPGGKPAEAIQTNLGDGASPGIEMIEQAVLIRYLKEPSERVTDISQLSLSNLNREADNLAHSDYEATASLLGKSGKNISNTGINYDNELRNALENFQSGQDMGVATWNMHARSLVGYDSATGMVTYHDPYYAGVDLTCSFEEFAKMKPNLSICKGTPSASTPAVNTASIPTEPSIRRDTAPLPEVKKSNTKAAAETSSSKLKIPAGYKEYSPAFGRRRIIGPNNEIMTEVDGKWVKRSY